MAERARVGRATLYRRPELRHWWKSIACGPKTPFTLCGLVVQVAQVRARVVFINPIVTSE